MIELFNILKEYGSPLYLYNHSILNEKCNNIKNFCNHIKRELPEGITVSMHYSTKANSNPEILSVAQKADLNVDCMSPFELLVDEKSGFTPDKILYVCNNITAEEMKLVHDKGVLICLDSISQVETWGQLFSGTEIMVRINPGTTGLGHSEKVITSGKVTKFGISEENIPLLIETAKKYDLRIIGTHQHLGSLFLNDKISDYINGVKVGLNIVKKYFKGIEIVDLGGGFGVPYFQNEEPLDFSRVEEDLIPILKEFVKEYSTIKEFKFEPGRYIPCEAGQVIGKVTAIKYENGTYWIGTDIGMNQLIRPAMYGSYHEIEVVHKNNNERAQVKANFCGNICESGDILGKDRLITLPEVGDIVVVHNSGAYGFSMSSNYTGRPRAAEVMEYEDGTYKLIRKRETLESMLQNIIFYN